MLSRRQFVTSVGASVILGPFLRAPAFGAGAPGKRAKRLLMFCTMGTNPAFWLPRAAPGDIFNVMTDPLAAVKDNIILINGLASGNPGEGHGSPGAITGCTNQQVGTPQVTSIDQFIAAALPTKTPIPALLL